MKIRDASDFDDFMGCLMLSNDYYFVEPFMKDLDYDLRLQKIGDKYRVYSRKSTSSWKQNCGKIEFKDYEMTDKYKKWMDEVSKINGGLDMFALDLCKKFTSTYHSTFERWN